MTTTTGDGGAGTGTGSGDAGSGPGRIVRVLGDYAALWIAIGRMTGILLADVGREIRAQHRLIKNGPGGPRK